MEWYLATQWRFVGCPRDTQWLRSYVRVKVQPLLEEKVSDKVSGSRQDRRTLLHPPPPVGSRAHQCHSVRCVHYDNLCQSSWAYWLTTSQPHHHIPLLNIWITYSLKPNKESWQPTSSIKSRWLYIERLREFNNYLIIVEGNFWWITTQLLNA